MFQWTCMEVLGKREDGWAEFCGKPAAPGENRCAEHGGTSIKYHRVPYEKPKEMRVRKGGVHPEPPKGPPTGPPPPPPSTPPRTRRVRRKG